MVASSNTFLLPKNRNAQIWRYISLSKFADLLERKALWFSVPAKFDDQFEGSFPLKPVKLKKDTKELDDDSLKQAVKKLADSFENVTAMAMSMTFVSCWHLSPHESEAMWRLYARLGDGIVAIQSTVHRLCECTDAHTYIGKVRYVDYLKDGFNSNNVFNLLLHKRKAFKHEQEIRALRCELPAVGHPGVYMRVDLDKLIEKIIVAPQTSEQTFAFLRRAVDTYNLNAQLVKSSLDIRPVRAPVYNELRISDGAKVKKSGD